MKKIILIFLASLTAMTCLFAQSTSLTLPTTDNTSNFYVTNGSSTLFNLNGDAGFYLRGTVGTGTIPTTGSGARLMWHPAKAAFRAGYDDGERWDDANIGNYSTAIGYCAVASGYASNATGFVTTASGGYSTAMGSNSTASGFISTAIGYLTTATGNYSTALGGHTTAQAYTSLVIGQYNEITGTTNSWVSTEPLFVCGNGTSSATSNALTLLKNGNMTIAGTLTQDSDIRLKENITPLDNVLSSIEKITPIYYSFKDTSSHPAGRQIGFSAQEIEKEFPELVTKDSKGYLSVEYANMTAVLLQAVKEQQKIISNQKNEITELKKDFEEMKMLMAKMATGETTTEITKKLE